MIQKRLCGLLAIALLAAAPAAAAFTPFPIPAGAHLQDPTFTPDGKAVYFTQGNADGTYAIVTSTMQGDAWSAPAVVPFSGHWRDLEEILSPDGQTMVFASNRPAVDGGQAIDGTYGGKTRPGMGGNLWRVRRNPGGWGTPERLPDSINANGNMFSPALAPDGTLYYMTTMADGHFHLFVAKPEGAAYAPSTVAPFDDSQYSSFDPVVASDGSFVIFSSNRPPTKPKTSDVFISYNRNGTWTAPSDISASVNPNGSTTEARLSPDNRTLYFNSATTLWRIDIAALVGASALPAPEIFAPSVVRDNDSSPSFSPDGATLIYARSTARHDEIVESRLAGGTWSKPAVVSFSGQASDMDPAFSPDGSFIVFASDRPPGGVPGKVVQLWKVARIGNGWGEPSPLPATINDGAFLVAPNIATDGTLYYLHIGDAHAHQLYRSLLINGTYAAPEALSFSTPATHDYDPAPAPDQSFVVFASSGRGNPSDKKRHLYITFAQGSAWSTPIRLHYAGETPSDDAGPLISRDAKTIYFSSDRNGRSAAWTLAFNSSASGQTAPRTSATLEP